MLTSAPITFLTPEKHAQELLNEWLQSYFTGTPHRHLTGERTFPKCDIRFNQAVLPSDTGGRPLIHVVFLEWPTDEEWHRGSDLGTWDAVLATPAGGVSYGRCGDTVVESVHGKRRRTLPGTDIRWQISGSDLLEQTRQGGTWTTIRTIAGTSALTWQRDAGDYVELTDGAAEVRRIIPTETLWDGALKTVSGRATFGLYSIVQAAGDTPRIEWLSRSIGAHLQELLRDPQQTAALQHKGMRKWQILHNPRNLSTQAAQVWYLSATSQIRYLLPREHTS